MIVKLVSFDKMINFTFSLRLRLVDLLTLYAPAYFFTNRVMYARQHGCNFVFVFFQRARVAWHVLRQSYGMRTLAYPTLCIIMSLCSFASLVDRACGPSREIQTQFGVIGMWKHTWSLATISSRILKVSIAKGHYCFPVQVRVLEKWYFLWLNAD